MSGLNGLKWIFWKENIPKECTGIKPKPGVSALNVLDLNVLGRKNSKRMFLHLLTFSAFFQGMVEAGSKKPITVSWTPPKGHDVSFVIHNIYDINELLHKN